MTATSSTPPSSADRYKAAGVDLGAAERTRERIRDLVASTYTNQTLSAFGAFGGMMRMPADIPDPVLVMSTDGVGTKVLVSILANRHDTVGEDLVNHSVNDILVHGARPVAFLDYIAGSDLHENTVASIVDGVARGCRAHGMALVGGETAQLPDLYQPGHYDVAGTIVGVVSEPLALPRDDIGPGDLLMGYASNGLHTNGYTLARQIIFKELGLRVDSHWDVLEASVGDVLLQVHRSYWSSVHPTINEIRGLAHITGGGIPGNLGRVLPASCGARVSASAWPIPPLFRVLQDAGKVQPDEMFQVFNMGLGMIAVVPSDHVDAVRAAGDAANVDTWVVGEVVKGEGIEITSD